MDANHAVQTNKYTCSHAFWCSKHLKNSAFNSHCKPPWGGFKKILTSKPGLQACFILGGRHWRCLNCQKTEATNAKISFVWMSCSQEGEIQ